jgi:hypothetical protein
MRIAEGFVQLTVRTDYCISEGPVGTQVPAILIESSSHFASVRPEEPGGYNRFYLYFIPSPQFVLRIHHTVVVFTFRLLVCDIKGGTETEGV